jgi:NAD dependent epimerase/dehydratase family enzyme
LALLFPWAAVIKSSSVPLALGEMANDLLLASIRVTPKRLIEPEYQFRQENLENSLRHLLGR